MSEPEADLTRIDGDPTAPLGRAYLVMNPDERFSSVLEKFYDEAARRRLGGSSIRIVAEKSFGVYERVLSFNPEGALSVQELSACESELSRRKAGGMNRGKVDRAVGARRIPPANGETTEQGIELRFGVHFSGLTAAALQGVWLTGDSVLRTYLRINGEELADVEQLVEARSELLAGLRSTGGHSVENVHISTPQHHV